MEGQGGEDGNVHDGQYANCKGYRMCEQTNKHTNIPADIYTCTDNAHPHIQSRMRARGSLRLATITPCACCVCTSVDTQVPI